MLLTNRKTAAEIEVKKTTFFFEYDSLFQYIMSRVGVENRCLKTFIHSISFHVVSLATQRDIKERNAVPYERALHRGRVLGLLL